MINVAERSQKHHRGLDAQGHSTKGLSIELSYHDHTLRDIFTDPRKFFAGRFSRWPAAPAIGGFRYFLPRCARVGAGKGARDE